MEIFQVLFYSMDKVWRFTGLQQQVSSCVSFQLSEILRTVSYEPI